MSIFATCKTTLLWAGLLLPLAQAGCVEKRQTAATGLQTSKVTSVSRVYLPAAGGQTIQVPKHMGDTHALWNPLKKSELHRKATVPDIPLGPLDDRLSAWLPPSESDTMRRYLYRLTHARRSLAKRVLARAEAYLPIILEAVERKGLPVELACLPMVESAFEPKAVSHAGAAGLWQLMPDTARRFGLTVNSRIDERFDVQKSTEAACGRPRHSR